MPGCHAKLGSIVRTRTIVTTLLLLIACAGNSRAEAEYDGYVARYINGPASGTAEAMAVMINGEKTTLEARQEFLFQTQDGKTAFDPTEIAKGIPLETLLRGYQVDTPNRLVVNLKSLKIDYAPVKVGNGDETAPGLVITCSIEVEPPRDLQPGTRTVTVSFPATMVLKRLLGAATPEKRLT